ncbi:DHA2 family efflux MFS transporter permease subunit [Nocardia sp. CDC159]|uniref:DHA2 family efflux MFS transporter permease subunit n=1 Tax=Nocardia pulmonis TaxID=2951408 RepID=A0A9X2IYK9_9NOCA|nr:MULTISPECIES: DHA2 family efflux MFS transporter permease subunit [Nocardia]MCM6775120.1 DHA2 family efflux MFS transporter permease subunit [Nocardia pulmonis]MCM6789590.1 DHA2 family efflux MFS transporter permease subunit [Nocardia sp. CDC159]
MGSVEVRRWGALGVLALGLSMVVLDGTIVNVSLPVIIEDLGLSFTQAQWVNSVYSVVFAGLLITAGRLGDRVGRRKVFAAGVVVFVAGSLLAAGAEDSGALIWGRIVQGVGGAAVLPGTLSTVNAVFRGRDRVIAFAVWGSVMSGMAAIGPLLGGWLTTSFTWPWIFLVNLPIGLVVLAGIVAFVPETHEREHARGVDVDGFLLSAAGFALVVFALIEGQTYGWWRPLREFRLFGLTWSADAAVSVVPVLLAVGLALLALFLRWERHRVRVKRSALLDLSLFRRRTFRWGNAAAFVVALGEFGLLFVLPLFLVDVLGLSTLRSGLVLAAMALGAFLAGGATEGLARGLGPVRIVRLGVGIEAAAIAVTALFVSPHIAPWLLAVLLACYGVGLGLASAQLTGTVLAGVPPEASGQGSATQSTVRQVGSALGAAVLGGVLSIGLGRFLADRLAAVPGLAPHAADQAAEATRTSAGGAIAGLREHQGTDAVVDALARGFTDATRLTMLVAAAFLLLGFLATTRIPVGAGQSSGIADAGDGS